LVLIFSKTRNFKAIVDFLRKEEMIFRLLLKKKLKLKFLDGELQL
jgi:hypothetical protein